MTLIPVDGVDDGVDHTGHLLIWTLCADRNQRVGTPYKSWIWDPLNDVVYHGPSFDVEPGTTEDPFCSGHTWMLDASGDPKFLLVGGALIQQMPLCGNGQQFGSRKASWFDPLTDFTNWLDGPEDIPDPYTLWYPSVTTFKDPDNDRFLPIVVGGSVCFNGGGSNGVYDEAWNYRPATNDWCTVDLGPDPEDYKWHLYPRLLQLSNGDVLSVGHQTGYEPYDPNPMAMDSYYMWPSHPHSWGGNPIQALDVAGLCSQSHFPGPDPNFDPATGMELYQVGGLNYCNAVILHTLKDAWVWDAQAIAQEDIVALLNNYHLDRVILTGGSVDRVRQVDTSPAQAYTLELQNAPAGPWRMKAMANPPRVYGNFVLLPDGTILLTGGQDAAPPQRTGGRNPTPAYYSTPQLFDPQGPTDLGAWRNGAPRDPSFGNTILEQPVFRGYHSVAILLANGSVALMGGKKDDQDFPEHTENESNDTVEIYKPPYFFGVNRPQLQAFPDTIHYGETFCVTVSAPARVVRACLIGVGSVTHHFDYGQRYVELMVNDVACGGGGNLEILAPPRATMAPEGYYLLFVVAKDAVGRHVPSIGKFVKVTF